MTSISATFSWCSAPERSGSAARRAIALLVLTVALLLAGCGGSSGPPVATTSVQPAPTRDTSRNIEGQYRYVLSVAGAGLGSLDACFGATKCVAEATSAWLDFSGAVNQLPEAPAPYDGLDGVVRANDEIIKPLAQKVLDCHAERGEPNCMSERADLQIALMDARARIEPYTS